MPLLFELSGAEYFQYESYFAPLGGPFLESAMKIYVSSFFDFMRLFIRFLYVIIFYCRTQSLFFYKYLNDSNMTILYEMKNATKMPSFEKDALIFWLKDVAMPCLMKPYSFLFFVRFSLWYLFLVASYLCVMRP